MTSRGLECPKAGLHTNLKLGATPEVAATRQPTDANLTPATAVAAAGRRSGASELEGEPVAPHLGTGGLLHHAVGL
jgi:hypothetical protein